MSNKDAKHIQYYWEEFKFKMKKVFKKELILLGIKLRTQITLDLYWWEELRILSPKFTPSTKTLKAEQWEFYKVFALLGVIVGVHNTHFKLVSPISG